MPAGVSKFLTNSDPPRPPNPLGSVVVSSEDGGRSNALQCDRKKRSSVARAVARRQSQSKRTQPLAKLASSMNPHAVYMRGDSDLLILVLGGRARPGIWGSGQVSQVVYLSTWLCPTACR